MIRLTSKFSLTVFSLLMGFLLSNNAVRADALNVSPSVLFALSGGYWEDDADAGEAPKNENDGNNKGVETVKQKGYYRALVLRKADNSSHLILQKIKMENATASIIETFEIEELEEMKIYITDMRPETSTGIFSKPGFVAYIYLKTDPKTVEPDTYELFIDSFGDLAFIPASN